MEMTLPSDDKVDWDKVRLDVKVAELTRNQICAKYHITTKRLANRIRENKWDVEEDATVHDRKIIIENLFLAVERQVGHLLEGQMSDSGERESALLGRLVTTLDRLISVDARVTGKKPTQRQSKEMTELRTKIAKRLDELQIR